jgi:predicted patatin/cPLA2 family phospholipase
MIKAFSYRLIAPVLLLLVLLLSGCAATLRNAVPVGHADRVEVSGIGKVRGWGDAEVPNFEQRARHRLEQIKQHRPSLLAKRNAAVSYLAISGGGADGAYGAGFLNGWTAAGTRPKFEVVTGVSTGALIAPFAFLGSSHDRQLKEIYTQYATKDLLQKQVLAGLLGGSSIASTKPLEGLIAKYVTRSLMEQVAREHESGRRLLVGTTNADQERPVIWDLGRIAIQRTPKALALFRRVLLASAALPGLFPPVYVKVTDTDGKTYEEMHIDGGVTDNTFLLPLHLNLSKIDRSSGVHWRRSLFIIANAKTAPTRKVVKATTFEIAGRSIETLIRQQLKGDLLTLYLRAQKNRIAFRLADIPKSFSAESKEPFDPVYMRKLYDVGYQLAFRSFKWKTKPPGL